MQRILFLIITLSTYMIPAFAEIVPSEDADEEGLERVYVIVNDAPANDDADAEGQEENIVVVYVATPAVPVPDFNNNIAQEDNFQAPAAPRTRRVMDREDLAPQRRRRLDPQEVNPGQPALMQAMLNAMFAHRIAAQAPITLDMINSRLN